jgi:integrase
MKLSTSSSLNLTIVFILFPFINRLVKGWAKALNLRGNYGSHTLRKTFGYIKHTVQGASLPELMVCFNHSTQRQTLDYLCIQEATIRNIYMNEI